MGGSRCLVSGLLGAVILFSLLAACGNTTDSAQTSNSILNPTKVSPNGPKDIGGGPNYGGILILANRGDPPAAFDSTRTSSIALHHIGGGLFGPGNLVKRCPKNMYIVCPSLARHWESNSAFTEWTFTIRDDAVWHDGVSFTAEDAKFWYDISHFGVRVGEKRRAPAYFKGDLGVVERTEVLSGNRLRIVLKQPAPRLLEVLANPRLKIAQPKHLMEPRIENGELSIAPLDIGLVGTGPFSFKAYEKGSLVQVRKFDDYWERDGQARSLPYLDGIDFVIMPNAAAMDAAFRTGRLDGGGRGEGHYLTAERMRGYDNDLGEDVFYTEIQGGIFRLAFNVLSSGPWQDVRIRRAMSLWINKQSAIPAALGGFGYISPILGPNNPFTSQDFTNWPRFNRGSLLENRDEALRLMAEAGFPDGFVMGHLCRARLAVRCEFLHSELAGLKIDLKLKLVDEAEWNRGRISLEYDSQQGAHTTSPVPEGTESVFGQFHSNPDAYSKHEDEKVRAYYNRLRTAYSRRQRVSIWRELEQYIVLEQAYVVPIAGSIQVVPYRTYVKGLVIPPEDGHTHTDFTTIWLER